LDPSSPLANSFGQEFAEVKFQGGRERPIHRDKLEANWKKMKDGRTLEKIAPLE